MRLIAVILQIRDSRNDVSFGPGLRSGRAQPRHQGDSEKRNPRQIVLCIHKASFFLMDIYFMNHLTATLLTSQLSDALRPHWDTDFLEFTES